MIYDYIIRNAAIYDGSGGNPFYSDVAIHNQKIAAIDTLESAQAKRIIHADGKAICPGFIDVHSHADLVIFKKNHHNLLEPLLRQGITTFVGCNCGMGLAPIHCDHQKDAIEYMSAIIGEDPSNDIQWNSFSDLMEVLDNRGVVLNTGLLIPHGLVRIAVKGLVNALATYEDVRAMKYFVEEGLDAGALGMSTGLMYFPGLASDDEELVELARVLVQKNAVFTSHLRSYTNTIQNAIDEIITISRRTGVKIQISHLFWIPHINSFIDGIVNQCIRTCATINKYIPLPIPLDTGLHYKLEYLENEIKHGLPLGIDAMPTGAGFTHALAFFPPWALEGSSEDVVARLKNKEMRKRIFESIQKGQSIWPHRDQNTWAMNFFKIMGFQSIFLMSVVSDKNKKYEGMNFIQIGKERNQHPFDAICDFLIEEDGKVLVFETPTYPGDEFVERSGYAAIRHPNVSIVTDSILIGFGKPSHLFYDCFPRLLSKYVRNEKILSLKEAIRKSTALPAQQLGIRERGWIKKGYWADLVLFDPNKICSRSTIEKPNATPIGIDYVWVNGQAVVTPEGYFPDPRSGHILRR